MIIATCGGIGDQILAFQAANRFCAEGGNCKPIIYSFSRKEVFEVLFTLFGNYFQIKHIDDEAEHKLLNDETYRNKVFKDNEFGLVWPDLLWSHPLSLKLYDSHIQIVKQIRLLTKHLIPENIIYFGLNTTTNGYLYNNIGQLLLNTARLLPNHTVYFPKIDKWNATPINIDLEFDFPKNVHIDTNPTFLKSLDYLKRSCYGVFADNGPSHIAYQLGLPRLVLDSRFGFNGLPWAARWRQDLTESIPISSSPSEIARLIKTNIEVPQTCLIPRHTVLVNQDVDWKQVLIIKY